MRSEKFSSLPIFKKSSTMTIIATLVEGSVNGSTDGVTHSVAKVNNAFHTAYQPFKLIKPIFNLFKHAKGHNNLFSVVSSPFSKSFDMSNVTSPAKSGFNLKV